MRRLIVVLAMLVAGCSSAAAPTPQIILVTPAPASVAATHDLSGLFSLFGEKVNWDYGPGGTGCAGTGGYADFKAGMPVTVKDQSGTIIGASTTGFEGTLGDTCTLNFKVGALPDGSFYSVEIGHRGAATYSKADLDKIGWKLALTLGK